MSISTIPGLPAAIGGKAALPGLGELFLENGQPLDFAALLAEQIPAGSQADPGLLTGEAPTASQVPDLRALKEIIAQTSAKTSSETDKTILATDDRQSSAIQPNTGDSAADILAALMPKSGQPEAKTPFTETEGKKKPTEEKVQKTAPEAEATPADPTLAAQYLAPLVAHPAQSRPNQPDSREQPLVADQPVKTGKALLAAGDRHPAQADDKPAASNEPASLSPATTPSSAPAAPPPASLVEPHLMQRADTANAAILAGDGTPGNSGNTPSFSAALAATGTPANLPPARPDQVAAISTPINAPSWPHDFGNRIVWLAKNDQQVAQININPPQLGPVQISISLNGDQASANFVSPHAEVRQAIHDSLPQLREMLTTAGISLGQANVGSQMPSQNREASYQFANEARSSGENAILSPDSHANPAPAGIPINRGRGLVDLFA